MTCTAVLWHGPGHQSQSRCHVEGDHDVHEAEYVGEAGFMITARWRNGSYTDQLRAKGIAFSPASYPDDMAMTGFFNEPPEEDPDA